MRNKIITQALTSIPMTGHMLDTCNNSNEFAASHNVLNPASECHQTKKGTP